MATKRVVTPKGTLEWVNITGEGKENLSGKLQYVANILLEGEPAKLLTAVITDYWEENKPKSVKTAKSLGFYPHKEKTDEVGDDGEPVYTITGKTSFAFKTGTEYADGKPKKIKTFNSKAKEVNLGETRIGNGSVGEISGAMGIYEVKDKKGKVLDAGVTLYLDSIKISKLVEFSSDSGFTMDEDNEDGFTGEAEFEGTQDQQAAPRL